MKNMVKLIFFDEEALSIDNQIMEQTLDNLREKVEAFFLLVQLQELKVSLIPLHLQWGNLL